MRRSRHCRVRADSSISAMLSQEPCLGVWWISSRWARANALLRLERLVQRPDAVGVEVVHDQHHGLGVGVVEGEQPLDLVGPVDLGPVGLGVDVAPAAQRLDPDEDRAGAVADVLAVLSAVAAGDGGDRVAGVAEQLVRASRPCTPPAGADRRVGRRRRGRLPSAAANSALACGGMVQHCLQMRTKFRFFNTRPMVEWSRSGRSSTNATCFSSSRNDHRACPAGGVEQANAISRASTSPVITDGTGGLSRCLRVIVASTSPPVSTNRFAISGPSLRHPDPCRDHARQQPGRRPRPAPAAPGPA